MLKTPKKKYPQFWRALVTHSKGKLTEYDHEEIKMQLIGSTNVNEVALLNGEILLRFKTKISKTKLPVFPGYKVVGYVEPKFRNEQNLRKQDYGEMRFELGEANKECLNSSNQELISSCCREGQCSEVTIETFRQEALRISISANKIIELTGDLIQKEAIRISISANKILEAFGKASVQQTDKEKEAASSLLKLYHGEMDVKHEEQKDQFLLQTMKHQERQ